MTKFVNVLGKFFVVIFLGILILGLVMWGIGDVLKNKGRTSVAEIGNTTINADEIDQIVAQQKRQFTMGNPGGEFSPEIENYLRQSALRQIVNTKLLENELHNLGIEFEAEHIINKDYTDAKTGEVDEEALQRDIAGYGGEDAFVNELVKNKKLDALESSMTSIVPLLDSYAKKIYSHNNQTRDIKLIKFNSNFIDSNASLKDSDILSFYNDRKGEYISPEYRSVNYILVDKSSLKNPSDDIAEAVYETANDLLDKLAEGASLADSAKELNLNIQRIESIDANGKDRSGNFVKLPELANFQSMIFSSNQDEISDLLESQDGLSYGVIVVDNIMPERVKSLDEVRGKVSEDLRDYNAMNMLFEKVNKIKAALSSGKTSLSSLVGQNGVEISDVPNLDKDSKKLPAQFIKLVFDAKNFSETFPDGNNIIMAKVEKINEPEAIDEIKLLDVRSGIQDQISQEIMMQYVGYLATKYKVNVTLPSVQTESE